MSSSYGFLLAFALLSYDLAEFKAASADAISLLASTALAVS